MDFCEHAIDLHIEYGVSSGKNPVDMLACLPCIFLKTADIPHFLIQAVNYKNIYIFKEIFKFALSTQINEHIGEKEPFYKKALEQAIKNAQVDIVEYVIHQFRENQASEKIFDNGILHQVAQIDCLDMVRLFVNNREKLGIQLGIQNAQGKTAAEVAASTISGRWLSPLRQLDSPERYQKDINLFQVACYLIQQGLRRGISFDISNKPIDTTLLHVACYAEFSEAVQELMAFLVKQSPNLVNDQDLDQKTPLDVAKEINNNKMVQFLLDHSHTVKIDLKQDLDANPSLFIWNFA